MQTLRSLTERPAFYTGLVVVLILIVLFVIYKQQTQLRCSVWQGATYCQKLKGERVVEVCALMRDGRLGRCRKIEEDE